MAVAFKAELRGRSVDVDADIDRCGAVDMAEVGRENVRVVFLGFSRKLYVIMFL